jgi:hypothetical protein
LDGFSHDDLRKHSKRRIHENLKIDHREKKRKATEGAEEKVCVYKEVRWLALLA